MFGLFGHFDFSVLPARRSGAILERSGSVICQGLRAAPTAFDSFNKRINFYSTSELSEKNKPLSNILILIWFSFKYNYFCLTTKAFFLFNKF